MLMDVLTYAVLLGCEFVALRAMTGGVRRAWPKPRELVALAVLAAVDVVAEVVWDSRRMPPDVWLAAQFTICWLVFAALTLWLSHDGLGRRIFLALSYGTYALGYSSFFDVIVYRPLVGTGENGIFDTPSALSVALGLAVVVLLNLVFVRWILPRLPRDGCEARWRDPCLVVGVMFAALFASCRWPVSVVFAPSRDCAPFVLVSIAAWIVFPMILGRMRDRQRTADIAHSLELMMTEVKVRRSAIDLARRLRHDQRHHRAQIAEYMLAGQYERVFDYLKALDEEAQEAPTDKLVWCENETVNAVLSGASRRATVQGVTLEVMANVSRAVGVPDVDLVALVANLVENAIDAAAKGLAALPCGSAVGRSAPERREKVTVSLRQREHGLGITVTNPVPSGFALSEEGLPCAEAGVGLESVRRVVERYGGQWSYDLKDGTLKCQVILMFPNTVIS